MKKKILYSSIIMLFVFILGTFAFSKPTPIVQEISNKSNEGQSTQTTVDTKETEGVVETKTPQKSSNPTVQDDYKYYSVTNVVDGDTVKVNKDGTTITLRLIGLDTPETVDPRKTVQCFGKEASNKAKELLIGKKVRIEPDTTQGTFDKYNRTLAYIHTEDGLFYNKYMIEQGYAHEYTYNTPYKYQTEFKKAQQIAKDNLRGFWSPNTCNGNTTSSSASTSNQAATITPPPVTPTQTTGKYYTSSSSNTKYYAPESCEYWKTWSSSNLRSFNSLEELQQVYPSRTLSPQCQ